MMLEYLHGLVSVNFLTEQIDVLSGSKDKIWISHFNLAYDHIKWRNAISDQKLAYP